MSRLDHHISAVRNKLTLGIFLDAWAWTGLLLAVLVLIAIIGQRVLDRAIAHPGALFLIGIGATTLGAWIFSVTRRPSAETAAVKIDEALGLKEKFSTALYARPLDDPFAQAAVRDAEGTAAKVSLYNRFPLKFPRQVITAAAIFFVAFLVAQFMPPLHLFAKHEKELAKATQNASTPERNDYVKQAMPTILAPAALPNASEKIRRATNDLNKAMNTDEGDELRNHRSVLSALQDYNKTMVEELKKNEKFQTSMEEQNQMSAIATAKDDSTPIGKAQNELKAGDLDSAMNDVSKAVNKFDKMKDADQQKMIEQAKTLAQELSKAANDPKVGQKIAQQLMQMGATQSQAQQMSAAMQQAAQGNKQAQQQLQQMAKQMAQQMNNGQGPTPAAATTDPIDDDQGAGDGQQPDAGAVIIDCRSAIEPGDGSGTGGGTAIIPRPAESFGTESGTRPDSGSTTRRSATGNGRSPAADAAAIAADAGERQGRAGDASRRQRRRAGRSRCRGWD